MFLNKHMFDTLRIKLLKKWIKRIVTQGNHNNIIQLYIEIFKAHYEEFTEENISSLKDYMQKSLQEALDKITLQQKEEWYLKIK